MVTISEIRIPVGAASWYNEEGKKLYTHGYYIDTRTARDAIKLLVPD